MEQRVYQKERAEARRNDILKTTAEVFAQKGYHEATIEEIAQRLKLTKGSIYYYVNSKQELLYKCHEAAINMFIKNLRKIASSKASPSEKLKKAIEAHVIELIDNLPFMWVLLYEEEALSPEMRAKMARKKDAYEKLLAKIIVEGIDSGDFMPADPKMTALVILGALNWLPKWYRMSGRLAKEEIASSFREILMRAVAKTDAGTA